MPASSAHEHVVSRGKRAGDRRSASLESAQSRAKEEVSRRSRRKERSREKPRSQSVSVSRPSIEHVRKCMLEQTKLHERPRGRRRASAPVFQSPTPASRTDVSTRCLQEWDRRERRSAEHEARRPRARLKVPVRRSASPQMSKGRRRANAPAFRPTQSVNQA